MTFLGKLFRKNKPSTDDARNLDNSETEPSPPSEDREGGRPQTFHNAVAITSSTARIHGVAVDVSGGGARLRFQSTSGLADIVRVKIPSLRIDSDVELRWVDKSDVGVRFKT